MEAQMINNNNFSDILSKLRNKNNNNEPPVDYKKIEMFAYAVIDRHGFRSTELDGFSCCIRDPFPENTKDSIFIWNFSRKHKRFELQIQKLHSIQRLKKMQEMQWSLQTYEENMLRVTPEFTKKFSEIGGRAIGSGVPFFEKIRLFNYEIKFEHCTKDILKNIELFTISNPIVNFFDNVLYYNENDEIKICLDGSIDFETSQSIWHFKCKNKEDLVWNSFFEN